MRQTPIVLPFLWFWYNRQCVMRWQRLLLPGGVHAHFVPVLPEYSSLCFLPFSLLLSEWLQLPAAESQEFILMTFYLQFNFQSMQRCIGILASHGATGITMDNKGVTNVTAELSLIVYCVYCPVNSPIPPVSPPENVIFSNWEVCNTGIQSAH